MEIMLQRYCSDHHGRKDGLCGSCAALLDYSMERLTRCPFGEEKPTCSKCHVHCYKTEMRDMVKAVMRYSGPRLMKTNPILALKHVVHGIVYKPRKKRSPRGEP